MSNAGPNNPTGNFQAFLETMAFGHIAEQATWANEQMLHLIQDLEPIKAVACVSGLLTFPELGANAFRIEKLVQRILRFARGTRRLQESDLHQLFQLLEQTGDARMEDPTEDVFISLVWYAGENIRVFEGLWECNAFYLQRFLNVLNSTPDDEPFVTLKQQVQCLLKLSEAITARRQLERYCLGEELPRSEIPSEIVAKLPSLAEIVRFTPSDLAELDIRSEHVSPFCFSLQDWQADLNDQDAAVKLMRSPLLMHGEEVYVVCPSCISPAIRLHIIEFVKKIDKTKALQESLAAEYSALIFDTRLLGLPPEAQFRWVRSDTLVAGDFVAEIDRGRFIHFLFVLDGFNDPEGTGLVGVSPDWGSIESIYNQRVRQFADFCTSRDLFRESLTLLVACGWGRVISFGIPDPKIANWRQISISIADLITLSRSRDMNPLNLVRILDHEQELRSANVELKNINGLLNLYGWAKDLDHHLIPHHQIEPKNGRTRSLFACHGQSEFPAAYSYTGSPRP